MKKYFLILLLPVLALFLSSCSNDSSNPVESNPTGSLYITSTPAGAKIYINSTYKGVTPDTLTGLSVGSDTVKITLDGYYDTTFVVNVVKDSVVKVSNVTLRTNAQLVVYGPIRIYETTGTGANQPSGLILSSGQTGSLSNSDIDLYYYSTSTGTVYELRSANRYSTSYRSTSFYVANGTDLMDGIASPLATSSWVTNIPDSTTTNYFFAYDNDMHYSKMKIVTVGGGSIGNPAYVEIKWIYNKTANDKRF